MICRQGITDKKKANFSLLYFLFTQHKNERKSERKITILTYLLDKEGVGYMLPDDVNRTQSNSIVNRIDQTQSN